MIYDKIEPKKQDNDKMSLVELGTYMKDEMEKIHQLAVICLC